MQKLIILVGIPGSGKSTYASRLRKKGIRIISTDYIRKTLFGDESYVGKGNIVFGRYYGLMCKYIKQGTDVCLDATNFKRTERRKTIRKALSIAPNIKIQCIYFDTSLEQCLINNKNRTRHVPENRIRNMYNVLDVPCYEEGFDEIIVKKYESGE